MSSVDPTKRQADRFRFLRRVYDDAGGNLLTPVAVEEAGTATGLFADEAENIALYLVEKDFIKWASIGIVMLTQWGIDEVERALLEPDRATSYFPPVNVMVIGTVSHSQVQQGTSGSSQSMTLSSTEREEITRVLAQVKEILSTVAMSPEQSADVAGNVATVEAQLSTTRPNRGIMREALVIVQEILGPFAAAATVVTAIAKLLTILLGAS